MPETMNEGPEELLALLMAMAQMKRREDNTGQCGEEGEWCFQLFASPMTVAATGSVAVDAALQGLRQSLLTAWQEGRAAVVAAADVAFPGPQWDVEWAFDGDNIQLMCTNPSP